MHNWIDRYEQGDLAALADRSHRPESCSHQIPPDLEALICEIRRQHPGWGPLRILHELDGWVHDYNNERPHQALEMEVPATRFRLVPETKDPSSVPVYSEEDRKGQWVLRRVRSKGVISVDTQMFSVGNSYKASSWTPSSTTPRSRCGIRTTSSRRWLV